MINRDDIWAAIEPLVLSAITPRASSLAAALLDIPNLQAAWIPQRAFSGAGATALQPDLLAGHDLTLTNTPTIVLQQAGRMSEIAYWNLVAASAMYLTRATETALALTNNFTLGVWVKPTTLPTGGNVAGLMGKGMSAAGNRCYMIYTAAAGNALFRVYDAGAAATTVTSTGVMTTGVWSFIQARFVGSSRMTVNLDGAFDYNVTSIPAAVRSIADEFSIGRLDGAAFYFNGAIGAAYVSASALADQSMMAIYQRTKGFYGQ